MCKHTHTHTHTQLAMCVCVYKQDGQIVILSFFATKWFKKERVIHQLDQ